jgi:hypothetical protein
VQVPKGSKVQKTAEDCLIANALFYVATEVLCMERTSETYCDLSQISQDSVAPGDGTDEDSIIGAHSDRVSDLQWLLQAGAKVGEPSRLIKATQMLQVTWLPAQVK